MTIAPQRTAMEPDLFRALLRRQAAAVVIVTAHGTPPAGFTATSFTSVSLRPPLISVNLDRSSSSWPTINAADYVGVHILRSDQEQLARRFATSGIDRFADGVSWQVGPAGVPLLAGCLAWLVCRVVNRIPAGDHAIVLAEPVVGQHLDDPHGPPLIYHLGRYVTVPYPGSGGNR